MSKMTIHLLGNAHLDPVWLWDWKEGLNQGLITCRTVLDLMDEFPELTFNRGEASIYQHIERTDRETFDRIRDFVDAGRWDVVGGTFVQPDDNMPATEPFIRQYHRGLDYFASQFDVKVQVAWSADCFGHSAGMHEVLTAAGIKYFAFTRPENNVFPLKKPAFYWMGAGGSPVLCYRPPFGWYGTNRDEMTARLDSALSCAESSGLKNIGCFYGLGDHGGGPSRRLIGDIKRWEAEHPNVRVIHSTMHRFFSELEHELKGHDANFLEQYSGELNYCLRGCYSSMAKFKAAYRKAESSLCVAERSDAVISAKLDRKPADLTSVWDVMLFNAFHDILPGSSIERAFDDQIRQVNAVVHDADKTQFDALNALALQIDTRVLPVDATSDMPTGVAGLVWNPHPQPFDGFVEFEACLDDRQIPQYRDRPDELPMRVLDHAKNPLPFQSVAVENRFAPFLPWRKRALIPMQLPAMGWSVIEMAWFEGASVPQKPEAKVQATAKFDAEKNACSISNGIYQVELHLGQKGIHIYRYGKPLLKGDGLGAVVLSDPSGAWGAEAIDTLAADTREAVETWTVTQMQIIEHGPWRAALWVRLAGERSRIDLTFQLYSGRDAVDVQARLMWDERSKRLNLVFPFEAEGAEFDVCAGRVRRSVIGDVPGGKWARFAAANAEFGPLGFASDLIYSFNVGRKQVHATVVRSTRFSETENMDSTAQPWIPATDVGEHKFRFLIAPGDEKLPSLAQSLCEAPAVLAVASKVGTLASRGELMSLQPGTLQLLAFKRATNDNGWILRLAETSGHATQPRFTLLGKEVKLAGVDANTIATYRIVSTPDGWIATGVDIAENPRNIDSRSAAKPQVRSVVQVTA